MQLSTIYPNACRYILKPYILHVDSWTYIIAHCTVSLLPLTQGDPSLAKSGTAGMYGMVGKIPDKGIVSDFVVEFFNRVYKVK